jgi:hypothetical protein
MGNKIVTEADRKFTPPLPALPGTTLRTGGRGQRVSLERGVATRSKKNPGKLCRACAQPLMFSVAFFSVFGWAFQA